MKEILESGGVVIYILICLSIVVLAIVLEKSWYYLKKENNRNVNSKIVIRELILSKKVKSFEHLEEIAREFALKLTFVLDNKLWILSLISHIAPLLGLFGTITGMIKAFSAIAVAGSGDPKILAEGIAEALITTAGGIVVAVPTTLFYKYFSKKKEALIMELETVTVETINGLRDVV